MTRGFTKDELKATLEELIKYVKDPVVNPYTGKFLKLLGVPASKQTKKPITPKTKADGDPAPKTITRKRGAADSKSGDEDGDDYDQLPPKKLSAPRGAISLEGVVRVVEEVEMTQRQRLLRKRPSQSMKLLRNSPSVSVTLHPMRAELKT